VPIIGGILPVRRFSFSAKYSKLLSFKISDGIDPVIALASTLNSLRPERSPIVVGIEPTMSFLSKEICSVAIKSALGDWYSIRMSSNGRSLT